MPRITYKLNFPKRTEDEYVFSVPETRKASLPTSGRKENVYRSMPLRESTNDMRNYSADKVKPIVQLMRENIEEKQTEEMREDTYNFTTNEASDVNLVLQKIEEARRQISILEQDSRELRGEVN